MKKLLVISGRGFPPELDTGVIRTLKIVKYLSRFGYSSIVLAPSMNVVKETDLSLMDDIPDDTEVVRSINPLFMLEHHSLQKLIKGFLIFDNDLGWLPFGYSKARRILEKERIDAIFSSSPPVVSHIIASMLRERTGTPWVADFRDAWTGHQEYWAPTNHHKHFEESVENRVMGVADKLLFASDVQLEDFRRTHQSIPPEKLVFLPTGFDFEDFNGLTPRKTGMLTFSHVGTVNYHYPLDFLRVFQELAVEIPEFGNFLADLARGKIPRIKPSQDYSAAIRVSIPPYPQDIDAGKSAGRPIKGIDSLKDIFLLDAQYTDRIVTAGVDGVIAEVTAKAPTLDALDKAVYQKVEKIKIPDKQFRSDGIEVAKKRIESLKEVNYAAER